MFSIKCSVFSIKCLMYYLLTDDNSFQVSCDILIGIANCKTGIFELFESYYNMNINNDENFQFNNDMVSINIYEINKENYDYLVSIYDESDVYENLMKNYSFDLRNMVNDYSYYYYVTIETDGEYLHELGYSKKYYDILNDKSTIHIL